MRLRFRTRRVVLLVVTAAAVAGVTLAILNRKVGHSVSAQSGPPTQTTTSVAVEQQIVPSTVGQSPPYPDQQRPPASAPTDDASGFAQIAATEVSQLRDGITLARWMDTRGKPEGWKRTPEKKITPTDGPGPECLSYMRVDTLPSGTTVVRTLYFYPPPVPSPATFPASTGQELIDTCLAGSIELDAEAPEVELNHELDRAARLQLAKQYGESVGRHDVPLWGRGSYYPDADRWIHDAEIVAGYDAQGLDVFVHARLPLLPQPGPRIFPDPAAAAHFHQAVAAAALDPALSQRMEGLYELDSTLAANLDKQVDKMCKTHCLPDELPKPTNDDWSSPLLPLLQDWFTTLKTAPPAQRAAGLYAADRLLIAFSSVRPGGHFGEVGSKHPKDAGKDRLRSSLEDLGAKFEPDFVDPSYNYTGTWLDEARQLAPDSEGGRLAELEWMSTAWHCPAAGGSEVFRQVITGGEALLAKKLDPATAAQVHFVVGDAYSDIVAIAGGESGANGEYDPGEFQNEASSAREKALSHYRAGLALDDGSENAKEASSQAWHLAAALLPSEHYVCFGD
jgi:hypothetical protein